MTRNKNRVATKIYYRLGDEALVPSCYEAYLLKQRPKEGSLIKKGNHLYITREDIFFGGDELNGKGETYHTILPDEKQSKLSIRMFWAQRHLAVGAAASLTARGVSLFPEEKCPDVEEFAEWQWPDDLTETVMTMDEVAETYGVTKEQITQDYAGHIFGAHARESYRTYLITRAAADRRYGEGKVKDYPINPLLLVFISMEASLLWNLNHGIIRMSAAGAGHRAARMEDGERRESGRFWLVTRDALERLYGPPVAEKMEKFNKPIVRRMTGYSKENEEK